jgi:hypothetical protein
LIRHSREPDTSATASPTNFGNVDIFDTLEGTVESAVKLTSAEIELQARRMVDDRHWHEFHRLWSSAVGSAGYDKSKWTAMERRLLLTARAGATENADFVLGEAARVATRT